MSGRGAGIADVPTEAVQTYLFGGLDNFPLLAVPFFVFAGEIMAQGGIARRIVAWVVAIIGGIRGSVAVTTVAASELLAPWRTPRSAPWWRSAG